MSRPFSDFIIFFNAITASLLYFATAISCDNYYYYYYYYYNITLLTKITHSTYIVNSGRKKWEIYVTKRESGR